MIFKFAVVNYKLNDKLKNNTTLVINTPRNIVVKIDKGARKRIATQARTISEYVTELKENSGIDYSVVGIEGDSELYDGMSIELTTIKNVVSSKVEDVPFEVKKIESADLYQGETKVKQVGVIGVKKITTTTVYVGNVESGTTVKEEVIVDPIPEIITVGTKSKNGMPNVPALNASYSKVLTLDATAYCPCSQCCGKWANGVTASGLKAGYGVVAVDKNVIPLGTKLYVEGYGYCVAGDTGGAIKGNRIDLCYGTHSQALSSGFGHKMVKVYILK